MSDTYGLPQENDRLEVFQDAANEWRWRLKAGNNEIIADSAEGYVTKRGAEEAALRAFPPKPTVVPPVGPSVMPAVAPVSRLPWWLIAIPAFLLGLLLGWLLGRDSGDDRGRLDPVPSVSTTIHRDTTDGTVITDGKTTVLSPTTASESPSGDPPPSSTDG